jgi:hypothetical protein
MRDTAGSFARRFVDWFHLCVSRVTARLGRDASIAVAAVALALVAYTGFRLSPLYASGKPKNSSAAVLPAGRTEVSALRTRFSNTYVNRDGTYTASLSASPVNYRDDKGDWQPIDSTLVPSSEPSFAFQNAANSFQAYFKDDLSPGYLTLAVAGKQYGLSLEGATPGAAINTTGDRATYANALTGAALQYDMLPDGVKESVVLQSGASPTRYTFDLTPPAGDDLAASELPDGSWAFTSSDSSAPLFEIAAPEITQGAPGHAPTANGATTTTAPTTTQTTETTTSATSTSATTTTTSAAEATTTTPQTGTSGTASTAPTTETTTAATGQDGATTTTDDSSSSGANASNSNSSTTTAETTTDASTTTTAQTNPTATVPSGPP